MVTALFLPCCQWLLSQSGFERSMIALVLVLVLMLPVMLLSRKRGWGRCLLVLTVAAVAVTADFFALERTMVPIYQMQGEQTVQGKILKWEVTDYGSRYLLQAEYPKQLKGKKARVYSYGEPAGEVGDLVEIDAQLNTDIHRSEWGRGIYFHLLSGEHPIRLIEERDSLREKLLSQMDLLYQPPVRGLVEGVLLGSREELEQPFYEMMQESGLVHLLAVSGIHLTMMAMFSRWLFSFLYLPQTWSFTLSLLPVVGYLVLAQFSPSAMRAALMSGMFVLGFILHQEEDGLSSLSVAAMVLLLWNPFVLWSISFQLSFGAALGILLCTTTLFQSIQQLLPVSWILGHLQGRWEALAIDICATVAASLAASVFSLPLLIFHFHTVPVWGILSSVLALWAVPPMMLLSMGALLFCMVDDLLGRSVFLLAERVLAGLSGLFARWILFVSKLVSQMPGSQLYLHGVGNLVCSLICVILLILFVYHFDEITTWQQRSRVKCVVSCIICCLCVNAAAQHLMNQGVLNVFSTEHALILTRDGQGAVVGDVCTGYEAREIASILRCEGVEQMEILLCDRDTTTKSAGIDLLLEQVPARAVAVPESGALYPHICRAAGEAKVITPEQLQVQLLGGVTISCRSGEAEIWAGQKKILKSEQNYAIIEQEEGAYYLLRERPVLRLMLNGKAGSSV